MYKWQNPRSGVVHANELLEGGTLCGRSLDLGLTSAYIAVEHDTEVTCLNCEREIRFMARDGWQYREWLGKPNAWHPRFGPDPGMEGFKNDKARYCEECGYETRNLAPAPHCGQPMLLVDGCVVVES